MLREGTNQVIKLQLGRLRIPSAHDKVYKDECVVSFDNPFSPDGLYVNLQTFMGYGKKYYLSDNIKTGSQLYLHLKYVQVAKAVSESSENVSKLAIGVDGGFMAESPFDIIKEHSLVIVNHDEITIPSNELPEKLVDVIDAVIAHQGMKSALTKSTWDANDEKIVSSYAESLVQLSNGKKISNDPSTWRCELSGKTDNLWLNLSTGHIGGGRKNWDGSGGSGAALKHYEDTGGLYPLCVKLGTITPHGADVWSYAPDEDCLVIDPLLPQHLAHWGIDIMQLEKTDKTMSELEVELNVKYDWSKILESGESLEVLNKPGFVGLRNIGSSCYMNSVLQSLLAIPEITERYFFEGRQRLLDSQTDDPAGDFSIQFSKICEALLTDRYLPPIAPDARMTVKDGEEESTSYLLEQYAIAPRMFKHLVGKNHPEFSTGRQQDAYEYFLYLLDAFIRNENSQITRLDPSIVDPKRGKLTPHLFEFHLQDRLQCQVTEQVKYSSLGQQSLSYAWDLRIPLDKAVNQAEVSEYQLNKKQRVEESQAGEDVKLLVPFEALRDSFFEDEIIEYVNPLIGQPVPTYKRVRFGTFPRYLMIKLGRYYVDSSWKLVKIDARVPMPEQLDISEYRSQGLQPGEVEMPSDEVATPAATASELAADEEIVNQLISMGFSENGCRKAAIATGNASADEAMNWVFAHMEDPDFNDPPKAPSKATSTASVDADAVMMLTSMGYSSDQAKAALLATDNNLERAGDWLISHSDDLDVAVREVSQPDRAGPASAAAPRLYDDGEGKYSLVAIISHIGKSTEHGHYVCHIKKEGIWAIFNDEKVKSAYNDNSLVVDNMSHQVAKSKVPPLEHGYMYLYRRDDGPGTFHDR